MLKHEIAVDKFAERIHRAIKDEKKRLGLLSSIDGKQIFALLLSAETGKAEIWQSELSTDSYPSLTPNLPQAHWFERAIFDQFGLEARSHPRLKPLLLSDAYPEGIYPLRSPDLPPPSCGDPSGSAEDHHKSQNQNQNQNQNQDKDKDREVQGHQDLQELQDLLESQEQQEHHADRRKFHFLRVSGEGVYELPVGPIHAGVIEPGHFRFSCFGETIVNLELQLGYLHRGVEKRFTELPWQKARFLAEAVSSDTTCANALAHAICMESLLEIEPSSKAQWLRSIALEIERLAMHIIDLAGLAGDIGMIALAASLSRLRGAALAMAELISGSRFLRAFIVPGGLRNFDEKLLLILKKSALDLKKELSFLLELFLSKPAVKERMEGVGKVSHSLALDFGLVGVAARASGVDFDSRTCFKQGAFPEQSLPAAVEQMGDVLSRAKVRVKELFNSLELIASLIDGLPEGEIYKTPPANLAADSTAFAVVEAFRGELIHLVFSGKDGKILRYAIKDPSMNNWTAISIAIRNNLIADFPLCNKSLSLSYSANDL